MQVSIFHTCLGVFLGLVYMMLLGMHVIFLLVNEGKRHYTVWATRRFFHVLSLLISAFAIAKTYVLVYAIYAGNIHALVLEPQSTFQWMDIAYIMGNVIMAIMIPFLWLQIALRLNLFKTSALWTQR